MDPHELLEPIQRAVAAIQPTLPSGSFGWKAAISRTSNLPVNEREFLIVYNYGMGGVWGFARAVSEAEIAKAFPELEVVHETPAWMTQEQERKTRSVSSFTIADASSYPKWLRTLVAERGA